MFLWAARAGLERANPSSAAGPQCAFVCRAPDGVVDVVLSYCHHTLCDRSLEALLPYLQSKGVGVVNASPLCMGLLTPQVGTKG